MCSLIPPVPAVRDRTSALCDAMAGAWPAFQRPELNRCQTSVLRVRHLFAEEIGHAAVAIREGSTLPASIVRTAAYGAVGNRPHMKSDRSIRTAISAGTTRRNRRRRVIMVAGLAMRTGLAQADGLDTVTPPPAMAVDPADGAFGAWQAVAAEVRATQPVWSSPLVTPTGMLEQRYRFDLDANRAGNGSATTELDGGKGVDLIVSDNTEIQFAAAPYFLRSGVAGTGRTDKGAIQPLAGFGDWPFLRVEQRLTSSPESEGNYVVSALLQVQAPSGIVPLSNDAWTYQPSLAFGKGWGAFDVQGTIGGVVPASNAATIGYQVQANVALQYHVQPIFWPELEMNWIYYANGRRGGLNQVSMTPGLIVGRFLLPDGLKVSVGVGYQVAVTPEYIANPLTPAYSHAWLFTARLNF